jgi:endonuclease/exonuclease/phosphatase family metal-dependent hydrolase
MQNLDLQEQLIMSYETDSVEYCAAGVMQWNLHAACDMQGKYNLKAQADVILKCNPDVVVLNEVDNHCRRSGCVDMTRELGTLTGMVFTQFAGAWLLPPDGMYGNAVLSRWPMKLIGAWHIPATLQEARTLTLMQIYAPAPFYAAVTHLNPYRGEDSVLVQVEAVRKIAELLARNAADHPVMLLGDFNCAPESDPVRELAKAGWRLEKPLKSYPANEPRISIDHIFIRSNDRDMEVADRKVVECNQASDHVPILNNVKIRK